MLYKRGVGPVFVRGLFRGCEVVVDVVEAWANRGDGSEGDEEGEAADEVGAGRGLAAHCGEDFGVGSVGSGGAGQRSDDDADGHEVEEVRNARDDNGVVLVGVRKSSPKGTQPSRDESEPERLIAGSIFEYFSEHLIGSWSWE